MQWRFSFSVYFALGKGLPAQVCFSFGQVDLPWLRHVLLGRGSLGAPSVNAAPESLHDLLFYTTVVEVAEILRSAQACKLCTTAHALADRRSLRSAMWRLRPSWMQKRAPSQEPSKRFGVWDPHENPGHRPNDRNSVTSQSEVESGKHLRCRWWD